MKRCRIRRSPSAGRHGHRHRGECTGGHLLRRRLRRNLSGQHARHPLRQGLGRVGVRRWEGDCAGTALKCAVPMARARSVTARFDSLSSVPSIWGVAPGFGDIAGGYTVTIRGASLAGAQTVTFDGVPATGLTRVSPGELRVVVPPMRRPTWCAGAIGRRHDAAVVSLQVRPFHRADAGVVWKLVCLVGQIAGLFYGGLGTTVSPCDLETDDALSAVSIGIRASSMFQQLLQNPPFPRFSSGAVAMSPVEPLLTLPDGRRISRTLNEVPGALFLEHDFLGEGTTQKVILLPEGVTGEGAPCASRATPACRASARTPRRVHRRRVHSAPAERPNPPWRTGGAPIGPASGAHVLPPRRRRRRRHPRCVGQLS